MNDRVFVDSNVFVYLFDSDSPDKQEVARRLLEGLVADSIVVVSTQVLQEFYVSVTRKLATPLPHREAAAATRRISGYTVVQVDVPLIFQAIDSSEREKISFWDSLIVRAAREANCGRLLSEDLQHGRELDDVRIENPFVSL